MSEQPGTVRTEGSVNGAADSARTEGLRAAQAACAVGLLYAAVSVYWGAGGGWLLDTVGGSLARLGRQHNAAVIAAVWAAAALKLLASVLPVLALRDSARVARVLAWIAAWILTGYGAALTLVGLLVQAGAIDTPTGADHRALAWHAFLWDPWFLVWGLLTLLALTRRRAGQLRRRPSRRDSRTETAGARACV
jgi:hypothetical protein